MGAKEIPVGNAQDHETGVSAANGGEKAKTRTDVVGSASSTEAQKQTAKADYADNDNALRANNPNHRPLEEVMNYNAAHVELFELGHRSKGFTCLLNPQEFEQTFETNYKRFNANGGSYEHMQFGNTKNQLVEMQLEWFVVGGADVKERDNPDKKEGWLMRLEASQQARNYLASWVYPEYVAGWCLGPPKLVLVWPRMFTLGVVLVEVKFQNLRFSLDLDVTRWSAKCKFELWNTVPISKASVQANVKNGNSDVG